MAPRPHSLSNTDTAQPWPSNSGRTMELLANEKPASKVPPHTDEMLGISNILRSA